MSELIDNRAHRISVLKEIIQHLHAGAAPELVKEQLRKIVGETDATEIMAMESTIDNRKSSDVLGILPLPKSSPCKTMPLVFMARGERVARSSKFYPGAL